MLISNANSAEYAIKVQTLWLEVDYLRFQNQATDLVNLYHDQTSRQQWADFCHHLNCHQEKQAVKGLIMQLAFRCLLAAVSSSELAQLITLTQHVKSLYGLRLLRDIVEKTEAKSPQLVDYLTLFQLLIDLEEIETVASDLRKQLPDLQAMLGFMYAKQDAYFKKRYPRRSVDALLEQFAKASTPFPLRQETLQSLKTDFLAIELALDKVKSLPLEALKDLFHQQGKDWRSAKNPEAKQMLVAILMENIRRFYKILPYDTQVIAFLALINEKEPKLRGRIAQIKAGEGKSTVFAMLVAFKAIEGNFVDLITSSDYLAIRDYKKYQPLLSALGLSSSHICHQKQEQQHFHAQILYGTNADFEFALLRDGLNKPKLRYSLAFNSDQLIARPFDTIFIDEVDNMLLDATGAARMAIPGREACSFIYKPILDYVREEIQNQRVNGETVAHLKRYLNHKIHASNKAELAKMPQAKLLRWLESAQIACYQKMEKRDYIVGEDIEIVDFANTGRISQGCQWQHGIHQFLQVKHGLTPTPESLTAASVAHPTYFGNYAEIYGLTGTMGEKAEREEIQEIYSVESFDVPPHLPCQRITLAPRILADESKQREVILGEIQKMQRARRPVLVVFESIADSELMHQFLIKKGIEHQLLNETQRESEDYIVARAGQPGMVTIATNTAGRGTDILLAPESRDAGGLHQIFAFYPDNSRVEEQGVCRGARQGQPGSSNMILQARDSRILSLLASSPASCLAWMQTQTDASKMQILNVLRSDKIQYESIRRRLGSKKEGLYFNCLNQFFKELQTLHATLETVECKQQLTEICRTASSQIRDPQSVNMKKGEWKSLYVNAKMLIANQKTGKTVDWSAFIDQYCALFVTHMQAVWGAFYSQLSDEGETADLTHLEQKIHQGFAQLDLQTQLASIKSSLSDLLYQAANPSEVADSYAGGFFSDKPEHYYKQAVNFIKEKHYRDALKYCELALKGYIAVKGAWSIEVGTCYSTAASCYRELQLFEKSLQACEESIQVFSEIEKKQPENKELLLVLKKYNACLEKSGFDIVPLYPAAVQLFKAENYQASAAVLLYLIEKFPDLSALQKGNCYSTLASNYRELGQQDKAIKSCENAIEQMNLVKIAPAKRSALLLPIQKKLANLKARSDCASAILNP